VISQPILKKISRIMKRKSRWKILRARRKNKKRNQRRIRKTQPMNRKIL
jgi:hypothetical protein